jgi:mRNA interferase RelE/StbE
MKRLPHNLSDRIMAKINQLAADPSLQANNVVALKGQDVLRLRVGDWRIIFSLSDEEVVIHRVAPRGSAYR